jgi:hypothetical protein
VHEAQVFTTPESRKEERSMSGNKGTLIFKNVIIGGYHPTGGDCCITIKDDGAVVWSKKLLQFRESLKYTPATIKIEVTIEPTKNSPGMGSWVARNKNQGKNPYDVGARLPISDINYYIIEDVEYYKITVFSNKAHVPAPADKYV